MMNILYVLYIIITGTAISFLISKNLKLQVRLSLGLGLGFLYYTLIPYIFLVFNIPIIRLINVVLILIALLLIYYVWSRNKAQIKLDLHFKYKLVHIFLLVFPIIYIFIANYWPISEWDALTLYDFRGRVFSEGGLLKDLSKLDEYDKYNSGYYFAYPPATSILHSSFYSLGMNNPKAIYPFFLISLTIFFYTSITQFLSKKLGLIVSTSVFFIVSLTTQALIPYTNLAYIYFYFVSIILLIESVTENSLNSGKLLLSAIFLAGSSWLRFVEPFYLINIFLLFYFLVIKKIKLAHLIMYMVPISLIRISWDKIQSAYTTSSFLNTKNLDLNINILIANFLKSTGFATKALLEFASDNIILLIILFICSVMFLFNKKRVEISKYISVTIYLSLVMIISGTLALGILLPNRIEIYDSIDRFGLFLYPLVMFNAALNMNLIKDRDL